MMNWPDVALATVLLAAIVVLHVFAAGNADARATVLLLVAAVSPWIASARTARKVDQNAQHREDGDG